MKLLGIELTWVAAGVPDVEPYECCAFSQFYAGTLIVAAALKGYRWAWQEHKNGAGIDGNIPLLRGETVQTGMKPRCRLAGDHGSGARTGGNRNELGVAVHEPGGRGQQIKQGWLSGLDLKGRKPAKRDFLIHLGQAPL